jgi:hypothetical protein
MSDTRVVLIVGPRQSGRTTLAKKIGNEVPPTFPAASDPWKWLTLSLFRTDGRAGISGKAIGTAHYIAATAAPNGVAIATRGKSHAFGNYNNPCLVDMPPYSDAPTQKNSTYDT